MRTLQFFQVMSMIMADWPIWRVHGVFFHGRSFNGDDDGLFELVGELTSSISENAVIINGGDGEGMVPGTRAWPGRDPYTQKLHTLKCNVVTSSPAKNTLEEAFAFSECAEKLGLKRTIVVGQPFQLLRIMLTHLKVMKKRCYPMQVYAVAPRPVSWTAVTSGNQGQADLVRFDQIKMEYDRLPTYQEQGNLATVSELIEYMLHDRDAI